MMEDYEEIRYAACKCYIWPVVALKVQESGNVGRCGRCDERAGLMSRSYKTKEDAIAAWVKEYGSPPEPIGPR